MQYLTIDGKFSTEFEAVENVLNSQVSKLNPVNGRFPICVKTQLSRNKMKFGVQFWSLEEIKNQVNYSDGVKYEIC